MATGAVAIEDTTAFALAEKAKLIKSLRRVDMVGFTICAFVGLDTLGSVAHERPGGVPLARRTGGRSLWRRTCC